MARTVTLTALTSRIRERGEFASGYISDAVLKDWINESIAELYDLICSVSKDYYLSSQTVTVSSGTNSYDLATAFYKCIGVDIIDGSGQTRNMQRYNFSERNQYQNSGSDKTVTRYRVQGSKLYLEPTPTYSGSITVWYVPVPTLLSATTDTLDGILGWDEYVVLDVLMKCAAKEESDVSVFAAQKEAVKKRILNMASERDVGEAPRVRDVVQEAMGQLFPTYWNP